MNRTLCPVHDNNYIVFDRAYANLSLRDKYDYAPYKCTICYDRPGTALYHKRCAPVFDLPARLRPLVCPDHPRDKLQLLATRISSDPVLRCRLIPVVELTTRSGVSLGPCYLTSIEPSGTPKRNVKLTLGGGNDHNGNFIWDTIVRETTEEVLPYIVYNGVKYDETNIAALANVRLDENLLEMYKHPLRSQIDDPANTYVHVSAKDGSLTSYTAYHCGRMTVDDLDRMNRFAALKRGIADPFPYAFRDIVGYELFGLDGSPMAPVLRANGECPEHDFSGVPASRWHNMLTGRIAGGAEDGVRDLARRVAADPISDSFLLA